MKTLRKGVLAAYQKALIARLLALKGAQTSDRGVLEFNGPSVDAELTAKALHTVQESVSAELVTVQGDELRRVEDALERVFDGTYGYCENCGVAIPQVRLKAVPDATRCVKCQRKVERRLGIWQREPDTPSSFDDSGFGESDLVGLDNCVRF